MATTRVRRAGANPPLYVPEKADERVYTEDDYAVKADAPLPDEWAATRDVYPAGWTGEAAMPDEAFSPDGEDFPAEEWAEEENPDFYAEEELPPARYFQEGDFTEDIDPLSEELLTEEEQAELRRSRWQLIANLSDFAGVIVGTAAILILVTLLISLLNWLINDLSQSFILLQKNF